MTGNSRMLREYNQVAILKIIKDKGKASKVELAEETGLSLNAVGMIANYLIEKGYINISGIGKSSGGRPPELLSIRENNFFSLGFDIDIDRIYVVKTDITGNVLEQKRISYDCVQNHENVFRLINEEIGKYYDEKLLGIGFAVAGQVQSETKTILNAPNLKWKNISLTDFITADIEIYIENEAITSAMYEGMSGESVGVDNFICINSKSGIGSGIFINGEVYKGASGTAGETGHMVLDVNGPLCECGNRGCLETFSSSKHICDKLSVKHINDAIELFESGDTKAREVFKLAGFYLGVAIANLINILNPEKIVLGKEFVKYGEFIKDDVRDTVFKMSLSKPFEAVEIALSKEGKLSSVLGASMLSWQKLYAF